MIVRLQVQVPGYTGPELCFYEGQVKEVVKMFPHTENPQFREVCSKARTWLTSGVAKELSSFGEIREHVLVVMGSN